MASTGGAEFPEHALGLQRDNGALEVRFAQLGRTVPVHLYQSPPYRMLFPRQERGAPLLGLMITISGGIAGGDVLRSSVEVGPGATAVITSQEAEKIYRSRGAPSRISTSLRVEEGAALEWLPQETILFDASRLERRVEVDVAPGGSLLALDLFVFGRLGRGERFSTGALLDAWRVRRGGRLAWADALQLEGDIAAQRESSAGLGGATAAGLLLLVADDAEAWLEPARARIAGLAGGRCRAGATLVGGALLVRVLGADAPEVRRALARLASWLRVARSGHPPRLPMDWPT